MNALRLLIADDERLIRQEIRAVLENHPGIEIVGECETGEQVFRGVHSFRPDLILLDIRMPDCTGLEVIRRIGPDRMPMVIFLTAYEKYAIEAFEVNAVDYLLKPFDEERLHSSLQRARARQLGENQRLATAQFQNTINSKASTGPERLVVKTGDRYEFVSIRSIDWIESANNYVELHCGERTHLLSETLSSLERRLEAHSFIRVHRCRIINVSRIATLQPMLHGSYMVEMKNGIRLTTGRQFKVAIDRLISNGTAGT